MKILHISNPVPVPPLGLGGTEKVVYNLAKTQAENGHQVSVMAGTPTMVPGVRDLSFVEGREYTENSFIPQRVLSRYTWKCFRKANQLDDFDIIHNHISEEAIPLSSISKYPVVSTLHCPMTLDRFWPKITNNIIKWLPKKTYFVAISKRSNRSYQPFYKKRLLTYIHHGMDLTSIPYNQKPKTEHELEICYLNRFIPEKNPLIAIKVVDLLAKKGYNVHLSLMGSMDNSDPEFSDQIRRNVEKREYVNLLPNISTPDMFKVLGNSHVMINPSVEIGLNLAQLEGLSTGTPVVGLVDGIAEEVVQPGKNGYLGKDIPEMAQQCLEAVKLDRKSCREHVEVNFSLDAMYKHYQTAYQETIERN